MSHQCHQCVQNVINASAKSQQTQHRILAIGRGLCTPAHRRTPDIHETWDPFVGSAKQCYGSAFSVKASKCASRDTNLHPQTCRGELLQLRFARSMAMHTNVGVTPHRLREIIAVKNKRMEWHLAVLKRAICCINRAWSTANTRNMKRLQCTHKIQAFYSIFYI